MNVFKNGTLNISTVFALKVIKCSFNTPSAPHQGGIWERLVRVFERVMYTTLGTCLLSGEVLITTFCLVEYALNARPLTPVSTSPSHLSAILPNHFLLGNQATGIPSIVGVDEFDHREGIARAQSYVNAKAILVSWLKECIPALNRRSKWQTSAEQLLDR